MQTFACFLDITGGVLANMVLVLDPDTFVLGGGLSNIAEPYLELPQAVARQLFAGTQSPPPLVLLVEHVGLPFLAAC